MHFVQTAVALVAAGGSALIIGGLVRESLRDGGRNIHLFPDAHDPPQLPVATPVEAPPANDAGPFPHSRGENAHRDKRGRARTDNDRKGQRQGSKQRRSVKKRDRRKRETETTGRPTAAESDDT